MRPRQFVNHLQSHSLASVFNPYRDHCDTYDRYNAAAIRRKTLLRILQKAEQTQVESIWLGRDLGYRGGRRTGLALTDDAHLDEHARRWDLDITRPTKGQPVTERTATVMWQLLAHIHEPLFLWNIFPFHPHPHLQPFSNRAHTGFERDLGEQILNSLVELLQPENIVAIGQHASNSAERLFPTRPIITVRHPSYGGQRIFLDTMRFHYKLTI